MNINNEGSKPRVALDKLQSAEQRETHFENLAEAAAENAKLLSRAKRIAGEWFGKESDTVTEKDVARESAEAEAMIIESMLESGEAENRTEASALLNLADLIRRGDIAGYSTTRDLLEINGILNSKKANTSPQVLEAANQAINVTFKGHESRLVTAFKSVGIEI